MVISAPLSYIAPKDLPQGYFKVYTMENQNKDFFNCDDLNQYASWLDEKDIKVNVSRISLFKPVYIDTEYSSYRLNTLQLNEMIYALFQRNTIFNNKEHDTNWKCIIKLINKTDLISDLDLSNFIVKIPEDLPIPDYSLL